MSKIEIYTWKTCPFCKRAKQLLKSKNVDFKEYDITGDEKGREKMAERTGGPKSVPQIFIDNQYIGGCDELHALDRKEALDPLLNE